MSATFNTILFDSFQIIFNLNRIIPKHHSLILSVVVVYLTNFTHILCNDFIST